MLPLDCFAAGPHSPAVEALPSIALERNRDCNPHAGVLAVVYVVPIIAVIDIDIVGFVPIWRPVFRPWIDKRDPITVVLEARVTAYKEHRKAADAEEVFTPEVAPETVFRNAVAVVTAALLPTAVISIPRAGARLGEAAAHLLLVLRDAAGVDAAIGGLCGLDAAMIRAAECLLRARHGSSRGLLLML